MEIIFTNSCFPVLSSFSNRGFVCVCVSVSVCAFTAAGMTRSNIHSVGLVSRRMSNDTEVLFEEIYLQTNESVM